MATIFPLSSADLDLLASSVPYASEPHLTAVTQTLMGMDQTAQTEVIRELALTSPGSFAALVSDGKWRWARHLTILDQALVRIANGMNKRLIVEMPPRHGKRFLCSTYFPAWYLGKFPDRNIILQSATDNLAEEFSTTARDLIGEFGPDIFGVRLRADLHSARRWQLEQGGGMRSAGIQGGVIGAWCALADHRRLPEKHRRGTE